MGKSKRKNLVNQAGAVPAVQNAMGVDAASFSPYRQFNFFPVCSRRDVARWGREVMISRARSLEFNSSEVRSAVKTLAMLVGTLKPLPNTEDEQWNRLAVEAFERRTRNPRLFDNAGALNFVQLQSYIEERASVDGDVLVVLTRTPDGGGGISVFPADQISGEGDENAPDGVITGPGGRPTAYVLRGRTGSYTVPVERAVLYRHNPDPTDPRGLTDLVACITTAQDIYEINAYNKAGVKLAASFGLVETVDPNEKRLNIMDLQALRNGGTPHPDGDNAAGGGTSTPAPPAPPPPLVVNGTTAITMSPGHKLETIHDTRPSNETRAFAKDLVDSIAYSVGLDPEILYRAKEMGSASVRFVIAKAKDWARPRIEDKEQLCERIWQHVIACEIDAGRLRPCRDYENAWRVKWVGCGKWSIDLGRDASSAISLINSGLMPADEYTLETSGMTREEIVEQAAAEYARARDICARYGVQLSELFPGLPGMTTPPAVQEEEVQK